jgi:hypothetical protein
VPGHLVPHGEPESGVPAWFHVNRIVIGGGPAGEIERAR